MAALSIISVLFIVGIAISNTSSSALPKGGREVSNLGKDLGETKKFKGPNTLKGGKKETMRKEETIMEVKKDHRNTKTGESKFGHCDYVDLVEVGYREGSNCGPGGKFLFKALPGVRRQFLMAPGTNIVVFLQRGKKVANCSSSMRDVTEKVKCKAVDGVLDLTIIRKSGGAACRNCAKESTGAALTEAPELGSAMAVLCRCPESRLFSCITTIKSSGNLHNITCNKMTTTSIRCGTPLFGQAAELISIVKYDHPLCTTKEYKSLSVDFTWRCKEPSAPVPSSNYCPGETTTGGAATTDAAKPTATETTETTNANTILTGSANATTAESTTSAETTAEQTTTTAAKTSVVTIATTAAATAALATTTRAVAATTQTVSTTAVNAATTTAAATTIAETTTAAVVATTTAPPCGADWEQVGQTCYRLVTNASPSLTYDGAASACKTLVTKGRLAAPKTSAIFTKLNDLNTGNADFWVGLDDRDTEGEWTFSDGNFFTKTGGTYASSSDPPTWSAAFTAWQTDQPVAEGAARDSQDCVKAADKKWDDVDCDTVALAAYACEKPVV